MFTALNHVNQKVRVIFAVDITFMTVFMTRLLLLVRSHVFFIGKVSEAVLIGTFDAPRSMAWRLNCRAMSGSV